MSSQSMASGDPYCSIHGFMPCRCWYYQQFSPAIYQSIQPVTLIQPLLAEMILTCPGCGKHPDACICKSTSNPCEDGTKPKAEIKTLAQSFKEMALKANEKFHSDEANKIYDLCLERCRVISQSGGFKTSFFKSSYFRDHHMESLKLACNLLEKSGFTITIFHNKSYVSEEADTELTISWE